MTSITPVQYTSRKWWQKILYNQLLPIASTRKPPSHRLRSGMLLWIEVPGGSVEAYHRLFRSRSMINFTVETGKSLKGKLYLLENRFNMCHIMCKDVFIQPLNSYCQNTNLSQNFPHFHILTKTISNWKYASTFNKSTISYLACSCHGCEALIYNYSNILLIV